MEERFLFQYNKQDMNKTDKFFILISSIVAYIAFILTSGAFDFIEQKFEDDNLATILLEEFTLPEEVAFRKLEDKFSPIIRLESNFIRTTDEEVNVELTSNEKLKVGNFGYYNLEENGEESSSYTLNVTDFGDGENYLGFSFTDQNDNVTTKSLWIERRQVLGVATDGSETLWLDGDDLMTVVDQQYSLSSDYYPHDLVYISEYNIPAVYSKFLLREVLIKDLSRMVEDAKRENCNLVVMSAYRSFYKQGTVFSQRAAAIGYAEALKQAARAGHSEHQLGTAIDFTNLERVKSATFGQTKEGQWLAGNAYKYGFILSYPEGSQEITGYQYEPWHYRYVGKEAANDIYKSGKIPIEYLKQVNGITR
jgi:LAS superfamily LD-carboxypeptidase LdcB